MRLPIEVLLKVTATEQDPSENLLFLIIYLQLGSLVRPNKVHRSSEIVQ